MSDSSDPMNCSLPGPSIHGIFQARVLEWGAIAFSITTAQVSPKLEEGDEFVGVSPFLHLTLFSRAILGLNCSAGKSNSLVLLCQGGGRRGNCYKNHIHCVW